MLDAAILDKLREIVGKENVATEVQDMICYGYDATQMEFLPDCVVHPDGASPAARSPRGAGSCW